MDPTDIARWQFAITTLYHFFFVPVTIGLSAIVAGYETAWMRTRRRAMAAADQVLRQAVPHQLRHRCRHRDRPGVPVRHELERLLPVRRRRLRRTAGHRGPARLLPRVDVPRPVDLRLGPALPRSTPRCIWLVHLGTLFSAYFILAANSWMQHPVGYAFNPETGRAEMNDFAAVLFNKVQLGTFPHVLLALHDRRGVRGRGRLLAPAERRQPRGPRPCTVSPCASGASIALVSGLGVAVPGDFQGKLMTEVQPMKMAAAEALYDTEDPAGFSIFHRQPGRRRGEVRGQGARSCCRSWPPAPRRQGRGDQRAVRAVPRRPTARTPARDYPRRLHP